MSAMLRTGGENAIMEAYASVLEVILRLRQTCLSPTLLPAGRVAAAQALLDKFEQAAKTDKGKPLTLEDAKKLLALLRGPDPTSDASGAEAETSPECSICLEAMLSGSARVLRPCRHYFCGPCLTNLMQSGLANRCPLCRSAFGRGDLITVSELEETMAQGSQDPECPAEPLAPQSEAQAEVPVKIRALLSCLAAMKKDDLSQKAVVGLITLNALFFM
eukprot:scaffold283836_cov44-Prasinocladus_malaysianus.AAC.1